METTYFDCSLTTQGPLKGLCVVPIACVGVRIVISWQQQQQKLDGSKGCGSRVSKIFHYFFATSKKRTCHAFSSCLVPVRERLRGRASGWFSLGCMRVEGSWSIVIQVSDRSLVDSNQSRQAKEKVTRRRVKPHTHTQQMFFPDQLSERNTSSNQHTAVTALPTAVQ